MRSRLATIASIVVLVFGIAVVGREVLRPPDDILLPFPTRDVVLAERAIDEGTTIEPEMIIVRAVPFDDTNSMAYADPPQALGKVAVIDILESQLITPNLLVEE